MFKSLWSRILLLVAGVVFFTAVTITFFVQKGTEQLLASEVDKHARDMVVAASEGQKAIEKYQKALDKQEPFEVAILDLTISGGKGGKEAAENILKMDPAAKIVISSGYAVDSIMANLTKYGFKGVVTKPYNLDKLSAVLTHAMEA